MPARRPSHRRQRNLQGKWLVLGINKTNEVQYHGLQAVLLPLRSGDHRRRYSTGQRLAVKPYVPGPTECHVHVTDVRGPASMFSLGQVDYTIARELGHVRLDTFQEAWVREHDTLWCEKVLPGLAVGVCEQDKILERFQSRWASKLAWLIRFRVDIAAEPRLLAARSDELYVTNEAMALKGEMPALTEDEWGTHVGPKSPYRIADRITQKRSETWQARLAAAKADARERGRDIRSECRRFDLLMAQGKTEKAMRQLDLLEARVFPVAA